MKKYYIVVFLIMIIVAVPVAQVQAATAYRVERGDTLWEISQKLGIPVKIIVDQNNISNPSSLYAGQQLVIRISVEDNRSNEEYMNYTVQSGDTLWKLAQTYDTTIEEIMEINNIQSAGSLYIGQSLVLPKNDLGDDNDSNDEYVYYTVKSGDILWNIAQQYDTTVAKLVELNDIKDAYDLYAGRQLIVAVNEKNEDNNSEGHIYYTVRPGDILWSIAQEYGTTVQKLVELNGIENAYDMYAGRQLIIPVDDNIEQGYNTYSYPLYYVYQAQEGEELLDIANKFGVRLSTLLDINDISDINEIEAGDSLVVYLDDSNKFAYLKRASTRLNNYYYVEANETLADIAEEFNTSEEVLRLINNLDEEEQLRIGQSLLMPINPAFFKEHQLYKIKEGGEYIFDIAFEQSITIRSLLQANYWKDPNVRLKAGKVIIVPLDEDSKTKWFEYANGKPQNGWIG